MLHTFGISSCLLVIAGLYALGVCALDACAKDVCEEAALLQMGNARQGMVHGKIAVARPFPPWQECSYEDSSSEHLCGRRVKFTKGSAVEHRWLYSNASFGREDGSAWHMQDEGTQMSTRVTVDETGVVTSSRQFDFVEIPDIEPLKNWSVEGLPPGTYNLNACPITYGDVSCSPARAIPDLLSTGRKIKLIVDSDLGVFMDDPFAIALASTLAFDLKLLITTSRNTTASAFIAAKLLYSLGRPDIPICAGFSAAPEDEQLMTPWALKPPKGSNMSTAQWISRLDRLIEQPKTNDMSTARRAQRLIRKLRLAGEISPEEPLVYWLIGPADSISHVQQLLSAEDKACVLVVAMGGSIVGGYIRGNSVRGSTSQLSGGSSLGLAQANRNHLPFGPSSGMSPWAETNVKGGDAVFGNGDGVRRYNSMVQDPQWAGLLLSTSEPVCDSQPGVDGTSEAWERFKTSSSSRAQAMMDMMKAWTLAAVSQCQGDNAVKLKCAPKHEAVGIVEQNFSYAPAQCDLTSIMPLLFPDRFGIEPMYLDFTTDSGGVRGCALQVERPPDKSCINVVTFYKPKNSTSNLDRTAETYDQGGDVRNGIIKLWLEDIELGELPAGTL